MRTNNELKAGDLRERIQFLNPTLFADGFGGYYSSMGVTYTCWAKVTNLNGTRQNSEDQMVIKNSWEIIIRDNPLVTITKSMHILYAGRTLIIDNIIDVLEYDRMIKLIAKERD
jgi:SPP1 family predicted phage head-tail adaptor